ncbi:MAG: hypothetical protein V3U54_07755 [Thermodesulfobacteriota bacterium]
MDTFDEHEHKALLTDVVSGIAFEVELKRTHRIDLAMSMRHDGLYEVKLKEPMLAKQAFFLIDRPFVFKVWDMLSSHEVPVIDDFVVTDINSELLTNIALDKHRPYLREIILRKINNLQVVDLTEKFKEKDRKTKLKMKQKEK